MIERHCIDELVSKLSDLNRIDELSLDSESSKGRNREGKYQYVYSMIHHGFYYHLAKVETNELALFNQISHFMKLLVEYAVDLKDFKSEVDIDTETRLISEIIGYHLFTFEQVGLIAGYTVPYLNRLLTNILVFCRQYPFQVFQTWLPFTNSGPSPALLDMSSATGFPASFPISTSSNSPPCTSFASFVSTKTHTKKLPVCNILQQLWSQNSMQYELVAYKNWIALVDLSRVSTLLNNYLNDRGDIIVHLLNIYFTNLLQQLNSTKFNTYNTQHLMTKLLLPTFESCSSILHNLYFDQLFIKRFENAINTYCTQTDIVVFAILEAFRTSNTPKTLRLFLSNEALKNYMIYQFEKRNLNLIKLLLYLLVFVKRHDTSIVDLIGIEDHFIDQSPQALFQLTTQTKAIAQHKTNAIAKRITEIITSASQSSSSSPSPLAITTTLRSSKPSTSSFNSSLSFSPISASSTSTFTSTSTCTIHSFRFDAKLPFSHILLKCLLQFFHHPVELNRQVIQFTSQIVRLFNILENLPFLHIIDYLTSCYKVYHKQWQVYDNCRFDSLQMNKLKTMPDIQPPQGSEILYRYNIKPLRELDYSTLSANLDLFENFMIDVYAYCKLRAMITKNDISHD